MVWDSLVELGAAELYLAGQYVRAGLYQEVNTHRTVHLEQEDFLPASLDGQVAAYILVRETWTPFLEPMSIGSCYSERGD